MRSSSRSLVRGARRWVAALALAPVLAFACIASSAHAHGPRAAVNAVLASTSDGIPSLVRLTEGLAQRQPTGLRYVCPALFGLEDSPLVAVDGDASTWVVGQDDLYQLADDGSVRPYGAPDLSATYVIAVAAAAEGILALRFSPDGSVLTQITARAQRDIFESEQPLHALAAGPDRIWLARLTPEGAELQELSSTGEPGSMLEVATEFVPGAVRLRVVAGEVFLHLFGGSEHVLYRAVSGELQPVTQSDTPIFGPVPTDPPDAPLLAVGGELMELRGLRLEPTEQARPEGRITCLDALHDAGFVCTQDAVWPLAAAGIVDVPALDLATLQPASVEPTDPDRANACRAQWLTFRADLARAGIVVEAAAGASMAAGSPEEAGGNPALGEALDASAPHDGSPEPAPPVVAAVDAADAPEKAPSGCAAGPEGGLPCPAIGVWILWFVARGALRRNGRQTETGAP